LPAVASARNLNFPEIPRFEGFILIKSFNKINVFLNLHSDELEYKMSPKIIKIPLSEVLKEIEDTLEDYGEYPYQAAFSIHELRQKLINHVLKEIPNCFPNRHTVIEDTQKIPRDSKFLYFSLEERVRLQTLIRGSIFHLLRENADWISRHIPEKEHSPNQNKSAVNEPSHRFG
jgi:hypothetical protein